MSIRIVAFGIVLVVSGFSISDVSAGPPPVDLGKVARNSSLDRNWINRTVGGITGVYRHVYTWTQTQPDRRYTSLNIFSYGDSFRDSDFDTTIEGSFIDSTSFREQLRVFNRFRVDIIDPDGVKIVSVSDFISQKGRRNLSVREFPGGLSAAEGRIYSNGGVRLDGIVLPKAGTYTLEISGSANVRTGGTGNFDNSPDSFDIEFGNAMYAINIRLGDRGPDFP